MFITAHPVIRQRAFTIDQQAQATLVLNSGGRLRNQQ
jgi:hypothetical protein